MDIYVRLFCVHVLCVGSGLATSLSPVQGALPILYRLKKLKNGQGPTEGCRATIIMIIIIIINNNNGRPLIAPPISYTGLAI
jgi:hypothetical protein